MASSVTSTLQFPSFNDFVVVNHDFHLCCDCLTEENLRKLPCVHLLCTECIIKLNQNAGGQNEFFPCPACTKQVRGGPTKFPVAREQLDANKARQAERERDPTELKADNVIRDFKMEFENMMKNNISRISKLQNPAMKQQAMQTSKRLWEDVKSTTKKVWKVVKINAAKAWGIVKALGSWIYEGMKSIVIWLFEGLKGVAWWCVEGALSAGEYLVKGGVEAGKYICDGIAYAGVHGVKGAADAGASAYQAAAYTSTCVYEGVKATGQYIAEAAQYIAECIQGSME